IETTLPGREILLHPVLNKGTAFTKAERTRLGLELLLPYGVATLATQTQRAYGQFAHEQGALKKNAFMNSMLDQNQVLFYRLLTEHLEEMLPIVYTPTEAEAIESYSEMFRRPRGLFLSYPDRECIGALLEEAGPAHVDIIVVTDGAMILGIGDQGVGGIWISTSKLALFTALGGVHPARVLPVVLDVGTDNQKLLDDPLYAGWREKRVRGKEYEAFVDTFVKAARKVLPGAMIHWEDFGRDEARTLLQKYRDQFCTFNDDMQGTGVVTLACLLSAMRHLKTELKDMRIVINGAGTAGTGIAEGSRSHPFTDAIAMYDPTHDLASARAQIYLVDKDGLLTTASPSPTPYQQPYLKPPLASNTLLDVIRTVKPHILIGVSTHPGAFTEQIVKEMHKHTPRPIIFPLSNPTRLAEARAEDLVEWTRGDVLTATGSPTDPVTYAGGTVTVAEANNAFVYPGIGMGCIVAGATRCTDAMLRAAARAVADAAPRDVREGLMPGIGESRGVSFRVACRVVECAVREGVATKVKEGEDVEECVRKAVWKPEYCPVVRVERL
ncbi:uncharacterized protein EV422DRAFT_609401, partial [Fimicolochytrium jonesii]|uniref:uncharacterized protein n=1 Tax=Fimicolochytrium jonesii TaxID=1396493 RepID=UPI0022FDBBA5